MIHDGAATKSGDMPDDLLIKVDSLLGEFVALVDALVEDRHLQKGIARSQLPCSVAAIVDRDHLNIIAQFRPENRFLTYIHKPEMTISYQKAVQSGQWEFGFEDPFVIQIPARLLDESSEQRRQELQEIASDHIDSEFMRFQGILSLMRGRPIFGSAPQVADARLTLILLPLGQSKDDNYEAIKGAIEASGVVASLPIDIRSGKAAVKDLWESINESRIVIADLTGPDPAVMYALGIAHTIGKDTVLIYPKGSKYLVDIPRTNGIEYEDSDSDRERLKKDLTELLLKMLKPVADI
jgi:hypothetical protein